MNATDGRGSGAAPALPQLLRLLFDHSPVAYQVYLPNGEPLLTNPAFRALFGEDTPGGALATDERGLSPHLRRAFAGEIVQLPARWYEPDDLKPLQVPPGQRMGGEVTLLPLRSDSGAVSCVALCYRDVKPELERQQAAERLEVLAESSRLFAAATSAGIPELLRVISGRLGAVIGEGCWIHLLSRDGQSLENLAAVAHPNPAKERALRDVTFTEPLRLGEGLIGKVAATGQPIFLPHISAAQLVPQTPERLRQALVSIDPASIIAVPLKSRTGVVGAVSLVRSPPGPAFTEAELHFAQDLADRAALAIENARLLSDLEERVTERTAELKHANRELESFSYSVSHDLRTPLRGIDGFSHVLLSEHAHQLDEEGKDFLRRIRLGAQRMSTLIDDLLNLARVARATTSRTRIDLSALARKVVDELRAREPSREVRVDIPDGLTTQGDARLLTVALENLLGNAWKFTSKRSHAHIELGHDREKGAFWLRDNGAGFDPAYSQKLFSPFQRLHRESEFEGTGIGLATVQRIIARHGGHIWAESAVDRGATFYFTLA